MINVLVQQWYKEKGKKKFVEKKGGGAGKVSFQDFDFHVDMVALMAVE